MTSTTYPTGVNPYYNGWTNAATVTAGGVGMHHPEGDCKKISTFILCMKVMNKIFGQLFKLPKPILHLIIKKSYI